MADDDSTPASPFAGSGGAFLAATLGTVSDYPRADTLLYRQVELTEIQIDSLRKQDEFELSHLRWRRFNDQMKGALQIMAVALGCSLASVSARRCGTPARPTASWSIASRSLQPMLRPASPAT